MVRVQAYMRKVFGTKTLSVRARPKIKDSAEVYVGEDFVGTLTARQRGRRAVLPVPDGDPRARSRGRVIGGAAARRAASCDLRTYCRPLSAQRALRTPAIARLDAPSLGSSDIHICGLR